MLLSLVGHISLVDRLPLSVSNLQHYEAARFSTICCFLTLSSSSVTSGWFDNKPIREKLCLDTTDSSVMLVIDPRFEYDGCTQSRSWRIASSSYRACWRRIVFRFWSYKLRFDLVGRRSSPICSLHRIDRGNEGPFTLSVLLVLMQSKSLLSKNIVSGLLSLELWIREQPKGIVCITLRLVRAIVNWLGGTGTRAMTEDRQCLLIVVEVTVECVWWMW